MNNRGVGFGFGILTVMAVLLLGALATIEPLKEAFDTARGDSALNCPGTPNFNQTAFDLDNNNVFEKLNKRGPCFVTGIGIVWFIGGFALALVVWVTKNWRARPRSIE